MLELLNKVQQSGGLWQFARFVLVGGAATLTDLVVSIILLYGLNLHENVVTTGAFAIAFFVSYFGHRNFTFKKQGSALKFLLLSTLMLIIRNLLVALMLYMGLSGLPPLLIAMTAVMMLTFVASKYLVFKG